MAISYKDYLAVHTTWTANQSFIKSGSILSQAVNGTESQAKDMKASLTQISDMKIISSSLSAQLKSCQEKLNAITNILPSMFSFKANLDACIEKLQAAIRAQRKRKFDNLTGTNDFSFLASNSLGLSWYKALDNITEMENSGRSSVLTPLSADQLRHFPVIKDSYHHMNLSGIPAEAIKKHYTLTHDTEVKEAVHQLVNVFPLLCVQCKHQYILIDYTELVFRPVIVYELLS